MKFTHLAAVALSAILGFTAVSVTTASSAIPHAAPASPQTVQSPVQPSDELAAAQTACDVLDAFVRVTECHVRSFNPSIDITIEASRSEAVGLCKAASKVLVDRVGGIAGKAWTIRVIAPATFTPSALCRV